MTSKPGRVRVAFVPATSLDHPYLVALGDALEAAGVEVAPPLPWTFGALRTRRRAVDVLHLHWTGYIYRGGPDAGPLRGAASLALHVLKLLWARALGYRVVWTVHNLYPHDRPAPLSRLERRVLVRVAHAVICHCEAARGDVAAHFARQDRVFVIPHGPLPAPLRVPAAGGRGTREAARRLLRVPDGAFLYLFLGEIRPYKGVEDLVTAFAARAGADDFLLIAGAPRPPALGEELRARLREVPNSRAFLRRLPEHRLAWLLRAADAVVLPYRRVTTSGVLSCAMAAGCRVVAPALGCIPETVDGRFAALYAPGDAEGFVSALEAVRHLDPDTARRAALEWAAAADWTRIAARTRDVYEESLRA